MRDWLLDAVERVALPRSWRYVVRMPMNEQSKITQQSLLALFDPLMPAPQWLEAARPLLLGAAMRRPATAAKLGARHPGQAARLAAALR